MLMLLTELEKSNIALRIKGMKIFQVLTSRDRFGSMLMINSPSFINSSSICLVKGTGLTEGPGVGPGWASFSDDGLTGAL